MKGFSFKDNPSHEGKTNTWLTPLWIINKITDFDLDPCGFNGHRTAKKIICLPDDGLNSEWKGNVWLNPPYGRFISLWIDKLKDHGNGVALVFGRTDTKWFQTSKPDMIFFLKGRIKFLDSQFKEQSNAGHGSALLIYGRSNCGKVLRSNLDGVWYK